VCELSLRNSNTRCCRAFVAERQTSLSGGESSRGKMTSKLKKRGNLKKSAGPELVGGSLFMNGPN